jgi:PAS domain S-box-containing protein
MGEVSVARTLGPAALVAAGCFLSALAFAHLNFPQLGGAILFPSYAILTAALLVTPPRRWWVFMLASAVGNFAPHHLTGPTEFVLLTEFANFTRAVLCAVIVRRFCPPNPFASLRGTLVFLGAAVVIAPAVAAVIGAGAVIAFRDQAFGLVWQAWFLSNALTGLALLPLLSMLAARPRLAPPTPRRLLEAACLSIGLVTVAILVFHAPATGLLPTTMYWPIPFLLWAAVRFGFTGTSAALLCVSTLTIWGAFEELGPFVTGSPTENLLELQGFLIVMSIPMLLLAALIEEQRHTSAELHESRAQYRSIVEDQTEMICRFRPEGTYTFVNAAFCRHVDRTREELLRASAFDTFPPGSLAAITKERPIVLRESHRRSADDRVTWQQWSHRAILDEEGRIIEYQSVGRDFTADKLREDRERELLAQRQREIWLREADRRKDEFLATLGHELRNPLAPISSALELLKLGGNRAARAREVIERQVGQMRRLVDDLLDVSRITRGEIHLIVEVVDATAIARQAVETARPMIDSRRHALTLSFPDEPLHIKADRVRLTQVLVNLLDNAAKFTDPEGQILVTLRQVDERAVFSIKDDGIGISQDMLETVFELFARGSRVREGMGIGLALTRRLVELQGGRIVAKSEGHGRGCEIVVELPVQSHDERTDDAPPSVAPESAPLRILVVDDNVDAADTLAQLLREWGHDARTAYDGATAIAAARAHPPNVVLSDIALPDVDGLLLARLLRREVPSPPSLFIAITGFGHEDDRQKSREAGFDHHLVKPFDPMRLAMLLATHRRDAEGTRDSC